MEGYSEEAGSRILRHAWCYVQDSRCSYEPLGEEDQARAAAVYILTSLNLGMLEERGEIRRDERGSWVRTPPYLEASHRVWVNPDKLDILADRIVAATAGRRVRSSRPALKKKAKKSTKK